MSKIYKLESDHHLFEFSEDDIRLIDIIKTTKDTYHLIVDNRSYSAEIVNIRLDERTVVLKLGRSLFEFRISTPLYQIIESLGLESKKKTSEAIIPAPMPGLVLRVFVSESQEIKKGDSLLILEAMKMENLIKATKDGIIKKIYIAIGDKVDKGDTLIWIE
ncbi:MAG: biotin/lipoyl-binding protein [Bacteroidota bacterium]|nr:biotin/lipoyl-binding protein [Bacteroidota bacterium]